MVKCIFKYSLICLTCIHLSDLCNLLSFQVEPIFLDSDNVANDLKINFHLELALTCPDTWVRHPTHLDLMYTCRNFTVFVDPTGLEPGVHSTYVKAFDVKQVLHNKNISNILFFLNRQFYFPIKKL